MSVHEEVVAEERAARKQRRSIEKATRARMRNIERRKAAEQRKAERARQRAAERTEREHQLSLATCEGQLSVVYPDVLSARTALEVWTSRGIDAVVVEVQTFAGTTGFAVVRS